jgi:protein-S-isoprenylcysteine O-methyltransferase Ste14
MTNYENSSTKMLEYKPPRIAMTLLAVAALIHFSLPITWPSLPSLFIPGGVLAALGFGVMLRAWWLFQQHQTAICPTAETTSFITDDIYALTRNPMYLGMVLILLGVALYAGSWPFYAVALIYALILNHVFCRYEERELRAQYGDEYSAYAARVRRWL